MIFLHVKAPAIPVPPNLKMARVEPTRCRPAAWGFLPAAGDLSIVDKVVSLSAYDHLPQVS